MKLSNQISIYHIYVSFKGDSNCIDTQVESYPKTIWLTVSHLKMDVVGSYHPSLLGSLTIFTVLLLLVPGNPILFITFPSHKFSASMAHIPTLQMSIKRESWEGRRCGPQKIPLNGKGHGNSLKWPGKKNSLKLTVILFTRLKKW